MEIPHFRISNWKLFPKSCSFFQISHVFRSSPYFSAVDGKADISRYRGRETENRQRRRASLSAADLTVSTLIAPDQHQHTCYQQAPPLLEYLNILKSHTARQGGHAIPPGSLQPPHCTAAITAPQPPYLYSSMPFLSLMSRNVYQNDAVLDGPARRYLNEGSKSDRGSQEVGNIRWIAIFVT